MPRDLSEARLLDECRWDHYRGPGPGGQKRNKTSSSARVTHLPTGISATAGESRSQARNKATALRRLRLRIARQVRCSNSGETFSAPQWFRELVEREHGLPGTHRERENPELLGIVLDALFARDASVSLAAADLHVSTAQLVKFLQEDPETLTIVNGWRKQRGLRSLGGTAAR